MDLREYLLLLVRRWPVVVASFLVVTGALMTASLLITPTYAATTEVYVRAQVDADSVTETVEGDELITTRIKSYARAVNSESVLVPVIEDLDLDSSFSELSRAVTAEVPSDTFLISITVEAADAAEAAEIANAIADQLPAAVAAMEGASSPTTSAAQFSVVQRALEPNGPVSPNQYLNAAIALVAGVLVAVTAAVLVEMFDSRVRRGSHLTEAGVRYLAGVPRLGPDDADLIAPPGSPEHRTYRRLALDVLFSAGQTPVGLVVTSPRAGAGTTSVAANLAAAMAAAGNRVLYIDANLDGHLADLVGLPSRVGVTDIIAGNADLDMTLLHWDQGGFSILPGGSAPVQDTELFGSPQFRSLLDVLMDLFDVVVYDTGPILDEAEAGLLLQQVSNGLLVAERRRTRRTEVEAAAEAVRRSGATLIGGVVTNLGRGRARRDARAEADPPSDADRVRTAGAGESDR